MLPKKLITSIIVFETKIHETPTPQSQLQMVF